MSYVVQTYVTEPGGCHRISIVDGMLVVNQITKANGIKASKVREKCNFYLRVTYKNQVLHEPTLHSPNNSYYP